MSRSRVFRNTFRSGVLSPNSLGLVDNDFYNSGLRIGKNIVIETMGGMKRRPGTLFVRGYGDVDYVRIFPFTFNRDQRYLIAIVLEKDTTSRMDIYRDNVLVKTDLVTPYNTADKIKSLDFAQSADSMILTQGDTQVYVLRRLGSDVDWDLVPLPIVNAPQYDPAKGTPPVLEDMWTAALGYPLHCTFHQGRLWFVGTKSFPQNVWSSKSQDFYNFDLGAGDAADSIQEALDTDYINPITGIFSARQLQLFTRGGEFINTASIITPSTSNWSSQSDYGSAYDVPAVAVDGSTLFVDSTGRTVRSFTYADERGGYDAPSVSAAAEHLVKQPQRMGVLRGDANEASNFVYVVNIDGTMATLNASRAHDLLAWTEWSTQGSYRDVVTVDREAYILVERWLDSISSPVTYNGVQVTYNGEDVWYGDSGAPGSIVSSWMLELISSDMLVDSGAILENLSATEPERLNKNANSFFGIYSGPDGRGYRVIVLDGEVVHKADYLKDDPEEPYIDVDDKLYTKGEVFSYNDDIRSLYFDVEFSFSWYMYVVSVAQLADIGRNFIDGLTHIVGREVVSTLDGNVQEPLIVVGGETENTLEKSYPDGIGWRFDVNNKLTEVYLNNVQTSTILVYDAITYADPSLTEYGYLIGGDVGVAGSVYIQNGVVKTNVIESFVFQGSSVGQGINSNSGLKTIGNEIYFANDGTEGLRLKLTDNGGIGDGISKGTVNRDTGTGIFGIVTLTRGVTVTGNKIVLVADMTLLSTVISYLIVGEVIYNPSTDSFSGSCSATITGGTDFSDFHMYLTTVGGGLQIKFGNEVSGASITTSYQPGALAGDLKSTRESEVRKMSLVDSVTSEGIVLYPGENFKTGQAGLFFPVIAETMPLSVSAGAGSLVNEPKRIVSVTSRYKDTQGVTVNGVELPERIFGEDVLDRPAPLITGIEKNRHLGYNRETSVTVSQNDPMPFTLLSLDIEVNY